MTSNSDLWARGVPLFHALTTFGDPTTVREWNATLDERPVLNMMTALVEQIQSGETSSEKFLKAQEASTRASNLRTGLEAQVRRQVYDGDLWAIGYSLPRHPEDEPRFVPNDVWAGKVNWEKSMLAGNGLEFVAVRICSAEGAGAIDVTPSRALIEAPRRPGRPSQRDKIEAAVAALIEAGAVDSALSVAGHFDAIRAKIAELFPELEGSNKGFSDKALYRVVPPILRRNGYDF